MIFSFAGVALILLLKTWYNPHAVPIASNLFCQKSLRALGYLLGNCFDHGKQFSKSLKVVVNLLCLISVHVPTILMMRSCQEI